MRFKPAVWFPIAGILAIVNIGATWFAARDAEPTHAMLHAALGVAFALWAERLRRRRIGDQNATVEDLQVQLDEIQAESRGQVAELEERLDFAERLLAQERKAQEVRPPQGPTSA